MAGNPTSPIWLTQSTSTSKGERNALLGNVGAQQVLVGESASESEADHRWKRVLDCLVQGANNSVEFIGGHRAVRNCTPEINRVFVADRKMRSDQPIVPAKKLVCELGSVVFWRRHDVGLVSQGSLAKGEPNRHDFF